jgi:hypothetical protein
MLSAEEKAYCRALEALKRKDYGAAVEAFDSCGGRFGNNASFKIMAEAARLMVALREECERKQEIQNKIKEAISHGKETIIRGQGVQEETRQRLPDLQ